MIRSNYKWGQEIYKWSTLGAATVVAIAVSLACSFWFFYSLMGGEGPQAIGAGIAGCTLQIFGYGFAVSFLKVNGFLRMLLCAMPLALSMFSSYSAIYGFLAHEQETKYGQNKKNEFVYQLLEQSAVDKQTASDAASKGMKGKFKSMGKDLLAANERAYERDMELLTRIEEPKLKSKASPLDGLVKLTGDASLTTTLFCTWLAVLFDLLPVVAISLLSTSSKGETAKVTPSLTEDSTNTSLVDKRTIATDANNTVEADALGEQANDSYIRLDEIEKTCAFQSDSEVGTAGLKQ